MVEALLLGRQGIGIDIDPLARMICRVKTSRLHPLEVSLAGERALARAAAIEQDVDQLREFFDRFDPESRRFIDYWFLKETQEQIASLLLAIDEEINIILREFLLLVLSSIVITKSGGVSLARDLAHSRPHKDLRKLPRNAHAQFRQRLVKSVKTLDSLPGTASGVTIQEGDARQLPLQDNSVDLIVTSPPYANAIDYMRAHKFSLVWLGQSITFLGEHRSRYIGAERIDRELSETLPSFTQQALAHLANLDARKERVVRKYFLDMRLALQEMWRVLKADTASIIVVGPSTMRGFVIPTQECLADIGREIGFDVVGVVARKLDRNRRMMPARFGSAKTTLIEERMHEEYIIALLKN